MSSTARLNANGRLTDEYLNFMEKMPENRESMTDDEILDWFISRRGGTREYLRWKIGKSEFEEWINETIVRTNYLYTWYICKAMNILNDVLLKDDLSSHLTLQRGRWFEEGVGEYLESIGLKLLPQLEISIHCENTPIKAQLDFTLVWEKPEFAVRVLEIKSMSQLPDSPYLQH